MGSIWVQQDPGGTHVGPMDRAIREIIRGEGLKTEPHQGGE